MCLSADSLSYYQLITVTDAVTDHCAMYDMRIIACIHAITLQMLTLQSKVLTV
jgi:hypothetical protein